MTKTITAVVASLFLLLAGVTHSQSDVRAQVMIFGVFHFANPGHDVVKTKTVNVLTEESQRYLKDLSMRLREFRPTVVLLEFDPANEAVMQERYKKYLDDKFELPVNEIYQLGFRIAKVSGVEKIGSFDEASIGWDAGPLFEYLSEYDLETERAFQLAIERYSAEQQQAHSELAKAKTSLVQMPQQDGGIETFGCTQGFNAKQRQGNVYWLSVGTATLRFSRTFWNSTRTAAPSTSYRICSSPRLT